MAANRAVLARRNGRGERRESGDTLVEVLVALVIIGICVVPLLNSLIESFTGSTQHRSVATIDTLLKSFAESAKSQIELNAPSAGGPFTACSTSTGGANYQLLSAPSPSTATVGTAVTVFGTGFHPNVPASTFSVTVGSTPATVLAGQSEQQSDSNGNIQLTFTVPTVAVGSQTVTVSDNQGTPTAVTSTADSGLTVASGAAGPTTSAESGYTMAINSVQYLDSDTGSFEACTSGADLAATTSGIEMVTLLATAPTGNSDTLSFVVRNPAYSATSIPRPTVIVATNPSTLSRPTGSSVTVTYTATVEPPSTNPQATGTVTWSGCTSTGQTTGSPNTIVATCTTTISSSSAFGAHNVTATYPGDAYNQASSGVGTVTVYASDGSGTMTANPTTEWAGSAGNTMTFTFTAGSGGMNNGEVDLTVPAGWSAPQSTSTTTAGYTTSSTGTVATSGQAIKVTGITLSATQTATIILGAGGGSAGETVPAATGSYVFSTSESSTSGGTVAPLASSPTVTVTSARLVSTGTATSGTVASASAPVVGSATVTYVVYAYTSNSGSGDSATPSAAGFTTPPVFIPIGSPQAFDSNKDHAWAWYTTGGSGTGTITVTFGNTIKQAFVDVVQLNGNSVVAPIVVPTEGFATNSGGTTTTATANLTGSPNSANPELIFLAAEGDFGSTAPTLSTPGGFVNLVSTDLSGGSRAIYTGLVTKNETLTMSSKQNWGTIALEING